MGAVFANNAATTLANPLTSTANTLSVASSAAFPTPTGNDYFLATLIGLDANGNEATWEIVKVSSVTSNSWTIERGQEGTPSLAWPQATRVELRLTAGQLFSASQVQEELDDKLDKASNLSGLNDAAAARTNLGLGSAATANASAFATPTDVSGRLAKASNLSDLPNKAAARNNLGLGGNNQPSFFRVTADYVKAQRNTPAVELASAGEVNQYAIAANISDTTDAGLHFRRGGRFGIPGSITMASMDNTGLTVYGDVNYTGTLNDISDLRLKDNITDLTDSLEKVAQLAGKSYTLRPDGDSDARTELGLIAQEVQPVFPEAVSTIAHPVLDDAGAPTGETGDYLGVSYVQLIAPMIEAIKALKARNEALEARVAALEATT